MVSRSITVAKSELSKERKATVKWLMERVSELVKQGANGVVQFRAYYYSRKPKAASKSKKGTRKK